MTPLRRAYDHGAMLALTRREDPIATMFRPLLAGDNVLTDHSDRVDLTLDVPGLEREDISVTVTGRRIAIEGATEQRRISYARDLAFVPDDVTAKLRNGVLVVRAAKPPIHQSRTVAIE